MNQNYKHHEAGTAPTMEELMADPIMRLILKRDWITATDTWEAVEITRRRLAVLRWRHAESVQPVRSVT